MTSPGGFTQYSLNFNLLTQVWQAQPNSTVTLANLDAIYPVYVSRSNGFVTLDSPNTIPILPLGQVTVNGATPLYALSQATEPLLVIFGDASWSGPQPAAALAVDSSLLPDPVNPFLVTVPANSPAILYKGPITGTSFTFEIDGLITVSPPTVPFMKTSIEWENISGKSQIDLDQWIQALTDVSPASSNMSISTRGPTKAGQATIRAINFDSNPAIVRGTLLSSSRQVAYVQPHNVSNNIATTMTYQGITYSTPISAPGAGILGTSVGILIPAGGIQYRLMPTFPGMVQFTANTSSMTSDLQVRMLGIDPDLATGTPPSELFPIATYQSNAVGAINVQNVVYPSCPVLISFANQNAMPETISYSVVALRSAA